MNKAEFSLKSQYIEDDIKAIGNQEYCIILTISSFNQTRVYRVYKSLDDFKARGLSDINDSNGAIDVIVWIYD